MAYTISPTPFQVVLGTTGAPQSGAKITTYLAGTSTLATTYTTSAGTANANPIVADSAGRFVAYLDPTLSYKFVYTTSADVAIKTVDNIAAVAAAIDLDVTGTAGETLSAGDVVYLSDGSGSLTAGRWYKTDADNTYSSSAAKTVGMLPSAIASAASGSIRLQGRITGLSGLSAGTGYNVSATAGALTSSTLTNVRFIGTADSTTAIVLTPSLSTAQSTSIVTQTSTATGAQADFALTTNVTQLVLTGAAPIFSGFAAGAAGQTVDIVFTGTTSCQILTQNAGSVAANRVIGPSTVGLTVGTNGVIRMTYDAAASRWRMATVSPGSSIAPTFDAGVYTTNGAGGWTVDSGDVTTYAYSQDNKQLTMWVYLVTTSVIEAVGTDLRVTIPGGFVATRAAWSPGSAGDNIGSSVFNNDSMTRVAASGTYVSSSLETNINWTASTNHTQLAYTITFEIN